jgi:hypothetical protein
MLSENPRSSSLVVTLVLDWWLLPQSDIAIAIDHPACDELAFVRPGFCLSGDAIVG